MSGAGVVHYHSLHRPRSVPTALGPAPLVTVIILILIFFVKQDKRVISRFWLFNLCNSEKNCKIGQCFILFGFGQELSFRCIPTSSEMCSLNLTHPSAHTPGVVDTVHSGKAPARPPHVTLYKIHLFKTR